MQEMMKLRDMLCGELAELGQVESLNMNTLHKIDTLAHAIKNLDRVMEREEYSGMSSRRSYRGSYDGSWDNGSYEGSYENSGRSYRRDSMGRYSRHGDFQEQLEKLMHEAPDDKMRKGIRQLISQIEQDGGQA